MVQILKNPGLGEQLGSSLGTGLSQLIEGKLQQVQRRNEQRQTAKGLGSIPGFTPEMAQAYSQLPSELLQPLIKQQLAAPGEQAYAQALQQILGGGQEQQMQQQDQGLDQSIGNGQSLTGLNAKQATELAKIGLDVKKMKKKEDLEEKKLELARQEKEDKETYPYYSELEKEDKLAGNSEKRVARLKKLAIKGNLGGPLRNSLIDLAKAGGWGLNLNFLKTGDAQEFEKASAEFIKNAKDIFGSRITDADLSAFMKTVPTLANSREGMLKIINNLEINNEAAKIKKAAADMIIKENGGRRPVNLKELVEKSTEKQIDDLANKFEVSKVRSELFGSPTLGSLAQATGVIY